MIVWSLSQPGNNHVAFEILEFINCIHKNINFTFEIERNSMEFLDLIFKFNTQWYQIVYLLVMISVKMLKVLKKYAKQFKA